MRDRATANDVPFAPLDKLFEPTVPKGPELPQVDTLDIAYNNADENGIARDRYTVVAGNVLDDNGFVDSLGTGYDIVVANIVAGVIVPLTDIVPRLLKKGGLYITSGIIAERAQEVIDAMQRNGFTVTYTENRKDWMVIVATR